MASRKATSIGFRFNRNDEDLLTEVNENSESEECNTEDRSSHQSSSLLSSSSKTNLDSSSTTLDEKKECNKKEKVSSVKEFSSRFKSKSAATTNPEQPNNGSPEGSSWFNDSWKKIQKVIDEKKEQMKKERETPVSVSFVGPGFNAGQSSINGDDGDANSFYFEEDASDSKTSDSKATTPTNDDYSESPRIEESPEDLGVLDEPTGINVVFDKSATETEFKEPIVELSVEEKEKPNVVDTVIESDPLTYLQWIIENLKYFRWSWSRIYYAFSMFMILPAFIITQTLPFPSFLNGLLFGISLTFILFGVLCVVLINTVFIKKADVVTTKAESVASESTNDDDELPVEIYKDWMYEYLIEESCAIESGKREKRTRLVYVRLDGTSLRISIPKSDVKRSKLPDNVAKITFANQKHYDFAKMKNKRLYFWLPKTVRNRKKYVFAKKYPLILVFDKCDQSTVKTIKLVLFVHNNRYKEEWYQRFRKAMGIVDRESVAKFEPLSDPPSPMDKKSQANSSAENMRRAQSFSSVTSGVTTGNSQSNFQKHYDQFLNKILDDPLLKSSSSSLLWFNLLVGRVFYDFLTHKHWSNWAAVKIQRKLSRIKLPYFIETLRLTAIDLGSNLPRFTAVNNSPQIDSKGLWVDFDVFYSGGLQMTLETKLNLMKLKDHGSLERELKPISKKLSFNDLSDSDEDSIVSSSDEEEERDTHSLEDSGKQMLLKFVDKLTSWKYFQTATDNKYVKKAMEEVSNTPLLLTVNVHELKGTLCVNVPKPPSDRLWYGFRPDPTLILSARPQLGEHLISTHHLLEWTQRKLAQMFNKILVVPNMDDIPLPVMFGNFNESLFVSYVP